MMKDRAGKIINLTTLVCLPRIMRVIKICPRLYPMPIVDGFITAHGKRDLETLAEHAEGLIDLPVVCRVGYPS